MDGRGMTAGERQRHGERAKLAREMDHKQLVLDLRSARREAERLQRMAAAILVRAVRSGQLRGSDVAAIIPPGRLAMEVL